jgi:hypothetical protein
MDVRPLRAAAAFAGVLALVSCSSGSRGGSSSYGAGDPSLAAAPPGVTTIDPFLSDGHAVLRALSDIESRSGKPLRVTSIGADQINGLAVDVQDPKKHVNVDNYTISPDGAVAGPTPVKLTSLNGGPVTAALVDLRAFNPRAINFAHLTQTVREAIAKSGFPDARVIEWEFGGLGHDDRKFIYLSAARGRPVAEVDPSLKIVHMQY